MKHTYKIFIIAFLCIVICIYGYIHFFHTTKEIKPVSVVKDEYVNCITQNEASEERIGDCLNTLAIHAYDTYGATEVASVLDTLSYQEKDRWCHEVMHYMGWRAFVTEKDIASAFMRSAELCDSGMYHGVMEEYLRQHGLQGSIEDIIKNICTTALSDNPNLSAGTKSLCYHGLGHGLMYITSANLKESLDYCDLLEGQNSYECYGGAFMEYAANKAVGPLSGKEKHDLSDFNYCSELSTKQKSSCLSRQGINNLMVALGDVNKAMTLCLAIDSQNDQEGCFQGVGSNVPGPSRTHADAAEACKGAIGVATTSYTLCIKGALGFVTQLDRGDTTGVIDFCEATNATEQTFCYETAGANINFWLTPEERIETKCALFPTEEAVQACVRGAIRS